MARGREEEFLDAEMVRACRSADTELIDYVLNRSEKGRENRYLVVGMYTAIKTKHIDIMKYLAERDAWIDSGGNSQQGFLAIKTTSIELLDTLYDLGWRPNVVSLIYAVHHTHDDNVLRWLLDHGARPDSFGGGLIMQGVALANRFEAVDMLLEHGDSVGVALQLAAQRHECVEMVKFLVGKGPELNSDDYLGTALTSALSTANIEVASWLLEQGAVPVSNKFGRELHLAEARLQSARELDAVEVSDESPTQDEQTVSVRYLEGGGKWLTTA